MSEILSTEELSSRINEWCEKNDVMPANGQAGESVTERNIRYYRTLGLLDAPEEGGYGRKHLLQLTSLRLLQAHGLPLRRIRELLYGRSIEELEEIRRRGIKELPRLTAAGRVPTPTEDELWRVIPLNEDFLLISRRGAALDPRRRKALLKVLEATANPKTRSSR